MRSVHPQADRAPVKIGARLRAARLAQNLTVAQLAGASGLTGGFLSRVERDEVSPSVSTLVLICQVLSLPIGDLFEAVESDLIKLEDAPLINMGGVHVTERLVTPRAQSMIQMLRSHLEPGAHGGEEQYTISSEVEVVHVLEGELQFDLSEQTMTIRAGDTLTFPGRSPHTWRNASDKPCEVLWVLAPAAWSGSR